MNKKGFTLIELLAVIVILAIIALIATPIILGIINDAKNSAKKRSAELVYSGIQYAYTTAMFGGTDGVTVADPSLDDIKNNFKADNVKDEKVTKDGDKLTITTDDGAYCEVTSDATKFEVTCKSSADATDTYFTKTVDKSLDAGTTGGTPATPGA